MSRANSQDLPLGENAAPISPPSGLNQGSASTPSLAIGASVGADYPVFSQRLTLIRHPLNRGVERTNHRSPVRGSNAGCDSNRSDEIGGVDQTTGAVTMAIATRPIIESTLSLLRGISRTKERRYHDYTAQPVL